MIFLPSVMKAIELKEHLVYFAILSVVVFPIDCIDLILVDASSETCKLNDCFFSVKEGKTNTLISSHTNSLLIYEDVSLVWAAQLPHVPVALKIANFQ